MKEFDSPILEFIMYKRNMCFRFLEQSFALIEIKFEEREKHRR